VLTLTHHLRRRRSRTMIGALISVAIPATLTVIAIAGNLTGQSRQDAAISDTAEHQVAAAARAAATGAPGSSQPTAAESTPGMRLLAAAAAAGENTSYQGIEFIARWTLTGTSTVMSTVSHSSGGTTVTETTQVAAPAPDGSQLSYDPYQDLPEGVFGVTKPLVTLLASHYTAVINGTDTVAGRAARIVEVRRANGQVAAKFWLDDQTGLPLRREDYDTKSQRITEATFIEVKFGGVQASSTAGAATAGAGWDDVAVPATLVSELRTKGWPLPTVLPGDLSLYAAAVSNDGAVDLAYSDGLFEVSLFVQRGVLSPKLAGWEPSKIAGRSVFISARGVTWSGKGYVYTVLSDASPEVLTDAVAALPHDPSATFWYRVGHGLHQLAHMVDPFR
jgi:hypothetical protein